MHTNNFLQLEQKNSYNSKAEQEKRNQASYQQTELSQHLKLIYQNKNKYILLAQMNQKFVHYLESGQFSLSEKRLEFSSPKKIKSDIDVQHQLLEDEKKIQQLSHQKEAIIQQLKQLEKQQSEIRVKRKKIFLQTKLHHRKAISQLSNHAQDNRNNSSIMFMSRQLQNQALNKSVSLKKVTLPKNPTQDQPNKKKNRMINMSKSYFTSQQKQAIHEIIKKTHKKQEQYKRKLNSLQQKIQAQRQQSLLKHRQSIEQLKQSRRQLVIQRQNNLKQQRRQFMRNRENRARFNTEPSQGLNDNQFFSDLNSTKRQTRPGRSFSRNYIYQSFEKQDREKFEQRKNYEQIVLQKRRQEKKIDFEEIKVHLQKYRQIKAKQLQVQREKIQNYRNTQKQRLRQIRQNYGFMTKIKQNLIEQERSEIEKYQRTINSRMNYHKKMKDYFSTVKSKSLSKSSISNDPSMTKTENQLHLRSKTSISQNNLSRQLTHYNPQKKLKLQRVQNVTPANKKYLLRMGGAQDNAKLKKGVIMPNSKQNRQKRELEMMSILKKEDSSMADIKHALDIFNLLNNTFWMTRSRQQIKSQAHKIKTKSTNSKYQ